jgi:hypothetical protein
MAKSNRDPSRATEQADDNGPGRMALDGYEKKGFRDALSEDLKGKKPHCPVCGSENIEPEQVCSLALAHGRDGAPVTPEPLIMWACQVCDHVLLFKGLRK